MQTQNSKHIGKELTSNWLHTIQSNVANILDFYSSVPVCWIRINDILKEEFVLYWPEGNLNCIPLCQVHHVVFSISSSPRSPKVHFPLSVSNWNCLCIFNFSSSFPLSHLSRCLSVHHPPTFTDQYKSCSCSPCNYVHPPANPSVIRPDIPLSLSSSTVFPCLFVGTQTHSIERN